MAKVFKDISNGNTLYVLQKFNNKFVFEESSVISISAPRADMAAQNNNFTPSFRQIVDVTYSIGGKTYTDVADVTSSVFTSTQSGTSTLIATDKEFVLNELKETLKQDEKMIKDIDNLKKRVKSTKELIGEVDVEYNEKLQTEQRLQKLENTTFENNELLKKLLDKLEPKQNKLI